mmetsp:Transcript_12974/g.48101  ORF Transcript_12974/g.48101 Transcript_12974/m.48101 type:complete len:259 (+) Transcript_12974:3725-4501(+)
MPRQSAKMPRREEQRAERGAPPNGGANQREKDAREGTGERLPDMSAEPELGVSCAPEVAAEWRTAAAPPAAAAAAAAAAVPLLFVLAGEAVAGAAAADTAVLVVVVVAAAAAAGVAAGVAAGAAGVRSTGGSDAAAGGAGVRGTGGSDGAGGRSSLGAAAAGVVVAGVVVAVGKDVADSPAAGAPRVAFLLALESAGTAFADPAATVAGFLAAAADAAAAYRLVRAVCCARRVLAAAAIHRTRWLYVRAADGPRAHLA